MKKYNVVCKLVDEIFEKKKGKEAIELIV